MAATNIVNKNFQASQKALEQISQSKPATWTAAGVGHLIAIAGIVTTFVPLVATPHWPALPREVNNE